jgi:hypothetical protein
MKVLTFLTMIIIFSFCGINNQKEKIEDKIKKLLEDNLTSENTYTIDLSTLASFEWDSLCVFETCDEITIKEVLGFEYYGSLESAARLAFLKNGKIIHDEVSFPDIETLEKGQIVFEKLPKSCYNVFTSKKFLAARRELERGGFYYYLTPIIQ